MGDRLINEGLKTIFLVSLANLNFSQYYLQTVGRPMDLVDSRCRPTVCAFFKCFCWTLYRYAT